MGIIALLFGFVLFVALFIIWGWKFIVFFSIFVVAVIIVNFIIGRLLGNNGS